MRRPLLILTILAAVVAALLTLPSVPARAQTPKPKSVAIIIAPYLRWEDVTATSTPTLYQLAQEGAVGAINARSRNRVREIADAGSPLEGALSISCGSWAAFDRSAAAAYSSSEKYEVGSAAEAFRRTTGDQVGDSKIVFLGMPVTQRMNALRSYGAIPGTLGQAIEDAGGKTAAIGNSDVGYVTGEQRRVRPAALIAMNTKGLVDYGDVSADLLAHDPYAAFGIETDLGRVEEEIVAVSETFAKQSGPSLLVLDPGDMYRVTKFRTQVTDSIYSEHRQRALGSLDAVAALASKHLPDTALIIVGQATGDPALREPEGMGPVIIRGAGYTGYLSSTSTQRDGLTTNLDITATVLDLLGVKRPVSVLGNPIKSVASGDSLATRLTRLSLLNSTAVSLDLSKPAVVNTFVAFTVIVLATASFVIVRSSKWRKTAVKPAVTILQAVMLLLMAVPLGSWLMFAWNRWPGTAGSVIGSLLATVLVIWLLLLALLWKAPGRVAAAIACLATSLVIIVDQVLGAPMSFTNFFGYSPLLAARFYGIGNEAAAMLFGSSITGMALLFDQWPVSSWTTGFKRFGFPVLAAVVVTVAAAPFWGANIAVVIWGVAGYGIGWLIMNGHHVSWRSVFWIFLGVVVIIGAFAAIDLNSGSQTHLARALGSAEEGGVSELWTIVARKAETNARVLTRTNWSYILIATLAFLGFMRWRPQGDFAATLTENPHFADAITVVLVAGLVAYFSEDSGIVIPALAVFYVGTALAWLMLARLEHAPCVDRGGEASSR